MQRILDYYFHPCQPLPGVAESKFHTSFPFEMKKLRFRVDPTC